MRGARRTAHNAGTQGSEVVFAELRMVQNRDIHRRHAINRRALFLFHALHNLHGVKLLGENHRHAVVNAAHYAKDASETVKKRHGNARLVAGGEVLARTNPESVIRDVAVRKLDALRETRRAARILHIHNVVDIHLILPREVILKRSLLREIFNLIKREHAAMFASAQEHYALHMRIFLGLQTAARAGLQFREESVDNIHITTIAVSVNDEEVFGVGLLKGEVEFVALVVRVERQENRTNFRRRHHQNHPMRDIRCPKSNLFAALYTERHKSASNAVDFLAKFVPGQAKIAVGINERVIFSATRDGLVEELSNRIFTRNGQIMPRHATRNTLRKRRMEWRCAKGVS